MIQIDLCDADAVWELVEHIERTRMNPALREDARNKVRRALQELEVAAMTLGETLGLSADRMRLWGLRSAVTPYSCEEVGQVSVLLNDSKVHAA